MNDPKVISRYVQAGIFSIIILFYWLSTYPVRLLTYFAKEEYALLRFSEVFLSKGLDFYVILVISASLLAIVLFLIQRTRLSWIAISLPMAEILLVLFATFYGIPFYYRIALFLSPPNSIKDIQDALDGPDLPNKYQYVYVLPDDVKAEDIEIWDGNTLLFQSTLPKEEIDAFYRDIYYKAQIDGFTVGGTEEEKTLINRLDNDAYVVYISREGNPTLVPIALCFEISECFDISID